MDLNEEEDEDGTAVDCAHRAISCTEQRPKTQDKRQKTKDKRQKTKDKDKRQRQKTKTKNNDKRQRQKTKTKNNDKRQRQRQKTTTKDKDKRQRQKTIDKGIIDLSLKSVTRFILYHSSVVHSEQGKLNFNTKDGIVPTMPYSRAAKTHAFTWYGTYINTFVPPRHLRSSQHQ
jgi:hypothetical protein